MSVCICRPPVSGRWAAGRREGAPPRLAVLAPRATRNCDVPSQLRARAGAAEVAEAAPLPAPHGEAPFTPTPAAGLPPPRDAGAGGAGAATRSPRTRVQLRGDVAASTRGW